MQACKQKIVKLPVLLFAPIVKVQVEVNPRTFRPKKQYRVFTGPKS